MGTPGGGHPLGIPHRNRRLFGPGQRQQRDERDVESPQLREKRLVDVFRVADHAHKSRRSGFHELLRLRERRDAGRHRDIELASLFENHIGDGRVKPRVVRPNK